jgi:hypothetical protein
MLFNTILHSGMKVLTFSVGIMEMHAKLISEFGCSTR